MTIPIITWEPGIEIPFEWFDKNNVEIICHQSVEEFMECLDQSDIDAALASGEPIEIVAYKRDMPTRGECAFLDDLLERLDEERTNPDGDWQDNYKTGGLEALKAAEQAFIDVLLANYEPWGMERAAVILVPVAEWLKEHP